MAEVVVCSLVRDGMEYLSSYRCQLESQRLDAGDSWRLCILEGDSRDGSYEYLERWAREDPRVTIGRMHVGAASGIDDRAARWARVGNACFDLIPRDSKHTHLLWLESDLCFPPELLRRLLAHRVDIVAPMIFLGGLFYDTWGFRDERGCRWTNEPPYHPSFRPWRLVEMGSVGSCVLFRREILDAGVRFRGPYADGLLVGMCHDARTKGFHVFADTATAILHPVTQWEQAMWRPNSVRVVDRSARESTLDVTTALSLGLEPNMSALDRDTIASAHALFWRSLFQRLETHLLDVEVLARAHPRKTYDLRVAARDPVGLLSFRKLRKRYLRSPLPLSIGLETERAGKIPVERWPRPCFCCHIGINSEPPS
jgi:hypothetical protein